MARVLCLSSHVVRGNVGLAATVPALQSLGHEVWTLPTISLAARPGLGAAATAPGGRRVTQAAELTAMLDALEQDGCWPMLDAVLTGYFASPETVAAAASAIARIKAAKPEARILVDPVIGDAGRLYVPVETATAIRDLLLPQADIATPNRFELQWLAGEKSLDDRVSVIETAQGLGPALVAVTSALEDKDDVTTLLVDEFHVVYEGRTCRLAAIPNGSGDLFAGLLLGHLLADCDEVDAAQYALVTLSRVLEDSAGRDVLQFDRLLGD
jgi:pyridoxine kinase